MQVSGCQGGTDSARVLYKGERWGFNKEQKVKYMNYKSVEDIKEIGPCLLTGHPKEHELGPKCWQAMRQFLYRKTFNQYLEAVENK